MVPGGLLVFAGWALGAECEDGSVVLNPRTGNVDVTHFDHDAQGNPIPRTAIFVHPTKFQASVQESHSYDPETGL